MLQPQNAWLDGLIIPAGQNWNRLFDLVEKFQLTYSIVKNWCELHNIQPLDEQAFLHQFTDYVTLRVSSLPIDAKAKATGLSGIDIELLTDDAKLLCIQLNYIIRGEAKWGKTLKNIK